MGRFGVSDRLFFPAISTNISVVEDGSEADVIALFQTVDGGIHKLFIENKIDAKLMPEQLERYVRRAEGEVRRGAIQSFSVLFFAPSTYLSASLPDGVIQISFEVVAQAFRDISSDLRSDYRASLLEKALPNRGSYSRDAQVARTEPYIKDWWDAVYAMLDNEFSGFFLHRTRYPQSVYFAPSTNGQASYLRVDFKGHKGEVDLAFKGVPSETLGKLLSGMQAAPGRLISNGKSSAIQIANLEPFIIADGFGIINSKVRAAYQAAHDLLVFWKNNRLAFDTLFGPIKFL